MSNRLLKSNLLTVVAAREEADAVFIAKGIWTNGVTGTVAARLLNNDNETLWAGEASRGRWGSASSSVADKLAKKLLKARRKDRAR